MAEHEHQRLTLEELKHYVTRGFSGLFEIEHVKLDRYGYDENDRYYGVGIPVFTVWWEHEDKNYNRGVRAEDYESLLKGLKLRWPNATTSRI